MTSRFRGVQGVAAVFWILACIAIIVWSLVPSYVVGWDLNVYRNAIHALQTGHDPYLDGIAVQRLFHSTLALHPLDSPPYTYVYSPLTLPLLGWIGSLPVRLSGGVYWSLYVISMATLLWVGMLTVDPGDRNEQRVFTLLAPAAVFFPGLLENDNLFSGNVAYLLYAAIFAAAMLGWKRGQWGWFYAATLAASCCKAPMLSLVAIPVLSARRQWIWAGLTAACGVALFAMQPMLWPVAFHNYLQAVELQFSFNHDFSSSPAGLLANALYYRIPYSTTSAVAYLLYGSAVLITLLVLRRRFLAGAITLRQWVPVLLVGVILLNPRIMEYDVAPITLMMALVAWRFFAHGRTLRQTIVGAAAFFVAITAGSLAYWKVTEGVLLCALFAAGAWTLLQPQVHALDAAAEPRKTELQSRPALQ